MIWTVTLNPALDCYLFPERFEKGAINSYEDCCFRPGGKGVNVSLLLTSLGVETTALAIGAGPSGRQIEALLREEGCKADFLCLEEGASRINLKLRTPEGEETDFNGRGPKIPRQAVERLGEKLSALRPGDGLVLAGSIPSSLPKDSYAGLLRKTAEKELFTVVDAAGEALLSALPCRPFLIKPNLEELEALFGTEIRGLSAVAECARALQEKGARNVAVSLGEQGALLVCEDGRRLFCHAAKGKAVSTIGAGDSMVAGFLYGWQLRHTLEDALRWGVSAGSATAFSQGIASGEEVRRLYSETGSVHAF